MTHFHQLVERDPSVIRGRVDEHVDVLASHLFRKIDHVGGAIDVKIRHIVWAERRNIGPHSTVSVDQDIDLFLFDQIEGRRLKFVRREIADVVHDHLDLSAEQTALRVYVLNGELFRLLHHEPVAGEGTGNRNGGAHLDRLVAGVGSGYGGTHERARQDQDCGANQRFYFCTIHHFEASLG